MNGGHAGVAAGVACLLALLPATAVAAPGVVHPGVVRPVDGAITRSFRPPDTPYGAGHRGVDLAAGAGAPVRSALAGRVVFAGDVARRGWVTVDHGGGLLTTYGVLASQTVRVGDRVEAGDVLGRLAEDAAHLDWGARVHGTYIDPLPLLAPWEARLVDPDRLGAAGPAPAHAPRGDPALTWPAQGRISSTFGMRRHPLSGRNLFHRGVDIAAPRGSPVVAADGGVVTHAGRLGGYGQTVVIDHGGGLTTRYAHAASIAVAAGERVQRGQLIARVGSTGRSTGPHVHFEVRVDGQPRDPQALW